MNIKDLVQPGDFCLIDSNKTAPKIVKYLMRSPTIWHDLKRMIFGKLEHPDLYHAFFILDKDRIIDQQGKVRIASSDKYLNSGNKLFIFRRKMQEDEEWTPDYLIQECQKDIGNWYGVMSCIAKTLTWLTGIKLFARYLHIPKTEICINWCCKWYYKVYNELFGSKTYLESTTWSVYKYVKAHPEKFEVVYEGVPRND